MNEDAELGVAIPVRNRVSLQRCPGGFIWGGTLREEAAAEGTGGNAKRSAMKCSPIHIHFPVGVILNAHAYSPVRAAGSSIFKPSLSRVHFSLSLEPSSLTAATSDSMTLDPRA